MKQTRQETIIAELLADGYHEAFTDSRKYRKFVATKIGHLDAGGTLWVGKAGAVRSGRTIGDSVSITDSFARWQPRYSKAAA